MEMKEYLCVGNGKLASMVNNYSHFRKSGKISLIAFPHFSTSFAHKP
jgi:hypothetical protein